MDLLDPSSAALEDLPTQSKTLMKMALNKWVLSFDNVEMITPAISNTLCRISTGGSISFNKPGSDTEMVAYKFRRPVVIDGIDELATRNDLIRRSVVVHLPRISKPDHSTFRKKLKKFEKSRPTILGALYAAVSVGLKTLGDPKLSKLGTTSWFEEWSVATGKAFGWKMKAILDEIRQNQGEALGASIEADPIIEFIIEKVVGVGKSWEGPKAKLLEEIIREVRKNGNPFNVKIPTATNQLTRRINRASEALMRMGYYVEPGKTNSFRTIKITPIADKS